MKSIFYAFLEAFCRAMKYVLGLLLIVFVLGFMTGTVMPICVDAFFAYIGFSSDADILVVLFMGGFPLLFLTLCLASLTILGLKYLCGRIVSCFDGWADKALARRKGLDDSKGEAEPDKPKKHVKLGDLRKKRTDKIA